MSTQERMMDFEEICKLGEGSFGTWFKIMHKVAKDIYVLRKIRLSEMCYAEREYLHKRLKIIKKLKWEFFVKHEEQNWFYKNYADLLSEYMDEGNIYQYLSKLDGKLLEEK